MKNYRSKMIHALEFGCQAPLRFYEHCAACSRFGDDCPDLKLGREILQGKTTLVYAKEASGEGVHVSSFKCLAPLYYFEKSRTNCAHLGRCREEGLLLALLSGKKKLDYAQPERPVVPLPARKRRAAAAARLKVAQTQD
jgi:hypothetical protein